MGSIPVTHVGSLPRSQEVVDLLSNRERGEAIDSAAFDATMRAAVDLTVARQIASGVDIVSGVFMPRPGAGRRPWMHRGDAHRWRC
jgi:5-methyltetrahydropteroyltriglutamate--homocysteine methyltransferase